MLVPSTSHPTCPSLPPPPLPTSSRNGRWQRVRRILPVPLFLLLSPPHHGIDVGSVYVSSYLSLCMDVGSVYVSSYLSLCMDVGRVYVSSYLSLCMDVGSVYVSSYLSLCMDVGSVYVSSYLSLCMDVGSVSSSSSSAHLITMRMLVASTSHPTCPSLPPPPPHFHT